MGFVEAQLYQVFAICMANVLPIKTPSGGAYMMDSWEAMWVFYSLKSFNAKRAILDDAITAYFTTRRRKKNFSRSGARPLKRRETGRSQLGKSLTRIQVGHIETAFCLFEKKIVAFGSKLRDSQELRDKDVQKALRLLVCDVRLSPSVRAEMRHLLRSLR